jgi:hypothetical protein
MSGLWVAPLVLVLLSLGWFGVQRAWLACMGRPADSDALARPGQCGGSCACSGDCPRRTRTPPVKPNCEEIAS